MSSRVIQTIRQLIPLPAAPQRASIQTFGLGTLIRIDASGVNPAEALNEAIRAIAAIDDRMSFFKNGSDVAGINRHAGLGFQKVGRDTYEVIKTAVNYAKLSSGSLDPTVRPLTDLWGLGGDRGRVPAEWEIRQKLALVDYRDIECDDIGQRVKLARKNQCLDLHCIAKGYAADAIAAMMRRRLIPSALIDLGGNIYALGAKPDGSPWRIGIQHPSKPRGNFLGFLKLKDRSVVTSGDYEKFFSVDGRKYHHIIDPRTGYPVANGIVSATVISPRSIDGDALTTCLYVMGVESGLRMIEKTPEIEALIVTSDGRIFTSNNLNHRFTMTDNEFRWG